ncbi:MAG: transketolase [Burkholderiales bacterium]|nr:transketolase [Burkholderiales bacterium]
MRKQLCDALVARAPRPGLVFLTGDLGFMALEELRTALGPRFINAGVAEQNMVSVAAGLARQGMEAWVYSIAPFCYARPFEQIRNDVAFHNLPVKLVGNGGGYGYGVMGPTHHAIEDYGVLLTLPNMGVFVPVFDQDIAAVIDRAGAAPHPVYLRLGRGEAPKGHEVPAYAPWRQLTAGGGPVVIAVGPLAGTYIESFAALPTGRRPNLWAVAELPLQRNPMPAELVSQLAACSSLHVAEEHVARGSFGSELALHLLAEGTAPPRLVHHHARAHVYERYGSQAWLRRQSALDAAAVLQAVAS